jgi:hypothetical protein
MARHGNPGGTTGAHGPPSDDALSNYDQVKNGVSTFLSLNTLININYYIPSNSVGAKSIHLCSTKAIVNVPNTIRILVLARYVFVPMYVCMYSKCIITKIRKGR